MKFAALLCFVVWKLLLLYSAYRPYVGLYYGRPM